MSDLILYTSEDGQTRLDPGGVAAISRWLSAATPPVRNRRMASTPEGSQHDEAPAPGCDPCRGRLWDSSQSPGRAARPGANGLNPYRDAAPPTSDIIKKDGELSPDSVVKDSLTTESDDTGW